MNDEPVVPSIPEPSPSEAPVEEVSTPPLDSRRDVEAAMQEAEKAVQAAVLGMGHPMG